MPSFFGVGAISISRCGLKELIQSPELILVREILYVEQIVMLGAQSEHLQPCLLALEHDLTPK